MKKRIRLLIISISLLVIVVSGIGVYSLLKTTKEKGPIKYEFGDIKYSISGDLLENYIYPGKNLVITPYKLNNSSTIDTDLRIKFVFHLKIAGVNEKLSLVEFLDYLEVDGIDFNADSSWTYDDEFYYYNETVSKTTSSIDLFSKLILDGKVVKNPFESTDFKVELIVHAKQHEYVTWQELGSKFID